MLKRRLNNKAQAALELAILGSVILVGFAVILMYGQNFEGQQQIKMEAFRKALQKSYQTNSAVSYVLQRDGRSFSLFSGFGRGQPSTLAGSASVMWQKGMSGVQDNMDSQTYTYSQKGNDFLGTEEPEGAPGDRVLTRYPKISVGYTGEPTTTWEAPETWAEDRLREEQYASSITKNETHGAIINRQEATLRETITTRPQVRLDVSENPDPAQLPGPPEYVYPGETYQTYPWPIPEGPQTLQEEPQLAVGAYFNATSGRIEYDRAHVGTEVYKIKEWNTTN